MHVVTVHVQTQRYIHVIYSVPVLQTSCAANGADKRPPSKSLSSFTSVLFVCFSILYRHVCICILFYSNCVCVVYVCMVEIERELENGSRMRMHPTSATREMPERPGTRGQ